MQVIETSTKQQFKPSSMPSKKVWVNIFSGVAVIERPDFLNEKKLVVVKMKYNILLKN